MEDAADVRENATERKTTLFSGKGEANYAGQRITRYQCDEFLNPSWGKAASAQNGSSSFRATEILPPNSNIIPNYSYSIEEVSSHTTGHFSPQKGA
ncbi:hypothetical protein Trydic_g2325 [Trypoxylus dichotomus]